MSRRSRRRHQVGSSELTRESNAARAGVGSSGRIPAARAQVIRLPANENGVAS